MLYVVVIMSVYRDTHVLCCSNNVCVLRYLCSVLVYSLCTEILRLNLAVIMSVYRDTHVLCFSM